MQHRVHCTRTGSSWRIHMSQQTCNLLEKAGGYVIEPRGPIEIKGKGKMHTYWLLGKKGFDKALPPPPPIGLDVAILKHSLFQSQQNHTKINNASIQSNTCSTANHSSSHSPSVTGESIDVKVEITPPVPPGPDQSQPTGHPDTAVLSTSFSIDSSSSNNTFTLNLGDFVQPKATPLPSPQARKLSEVIADGTFLNANPNFDRLNPSPTSTASSTRLFKRIEELIDLSSPYNYYKCLSPSENNLSQCTESRYGSYQLRSDSCSSKPGSTRFLRRQFSLDKDDVGPLSGGTTSGATMSQKATLDTISSISVDREQLARMGTLTSIPSISSTNSASLPGGGQKQRGLAMHRQQSASVAQDLEKIEEIPLSPQSFIINHTGSSSTSSLQSEINERGRAFRNGGGGPTDRAHNGKELRLSVEALGLR
uniref:Guanylate cyclase domain-containing protein n=1 Tax=Anopheles maculatus TaxID=74869 RepID=A0A182S8C5_9DIPT